jgi:two-component system sensor kinase
LRAIHGFGSFLYEEYADVLDQEGRIYLDRILESSQHMAQLIDDLLVLSRLGHQNVKPAQLDLAELAQNIFKQLANEQPERILEFTASSCPKIQADRNLIEVMLTNLLSNALKFTRESDPAKIEFGCDSVDNETVF